MRMVGRVAALVVLWLLAWGELNVASVLSGVVVASILFVVFPPGPPAAMRIMPLGLARLLGYVAVQLVVSNLVMLRQILRLHPDLEPGVVRHHLDDRSAEVVTVMANVISLSPGTMVVDVAADSSWIDVHFLRLVDRASAQQSLERLERLVVDAIGAGQGPRTWSGTSEARS